METLAELARRIAELERRVSNTMRHGTVKEVDPKKQMVRLTLGDGDDGEEFLGPWVPYSQQAGALKIHSPPTVGQTMTMLSPGGDFEQGNAIPYTFSDANKSPSEKGDETVVTYGENVRMQLSDKLIKMTVGGVDYNFSDQGIDVSNGHIKHNGLKIDSSHTHRDVVPGGGNTGIPNP